MSRNETDKKQVVLGVVHSPDWEETFRGASATAGYEFQGVESVVQATEVMADTQTQFDFIITTLQGGDWRIVNSLALQKGASTILVTKNRFKDRGINAEEEAQEANVIYIEHSPNTEQELTEVLSNLPDQF